MTRKHPATRIASLTLITVLMLTTAVSAASGTINATDVKLREEPTTDARTLDVLDKDTVLHVMGVQGDWVQVTKGDFRGYVFGRYVTITDEQSPATAPTDAARTTDGATPATASSPAQAAVSTSILGTVNASDVKFRKGPDTAFEIIRTVDKDTQVVVLKKLEQWQQVRIDGVDGYIFSQFVTLPANASAPEEKNVIRYVNANSLNIRSLPTTDSEKLGELTRQNKVVYLENIAGWARIETAAGIIGYVKPEYLVDNLAAVSRGNDEKVERLLQISKTFLGVPYVHGGYSMKGTDCSGFVKMAFAKVGITTPRSSSAYGSAGVRITRDNLRPGDVVTFDIRNNGTIGHVGIYLGNDQFIHASSTKGKVVIARFSTYNEKYMGARRFIR